MTYGHIDTTTGGKRIFTAEGCAYCQMSTGGQHSSNCPYAPNKYEYPIDLNNLPDKKEEK